MIKGHDVNFNNLNSPIELKELNDILNYILYELKNSFHVFTKIVSCNAGEWCEITFDCTYDNEPFVTAYSAEGNAVLVRKNPNDTDMTKRLRVSFSDSTVSGDINIAAIGNIK